MLGAVKSAGALVLAALVMSAPVLAQNWIKVPPPIVPRTADGKPDLQAPAPRTPDGKARPDAAPGRRRTTRFFATSPGG